MIFNFQYVSENRKTKKILILYFQFEIKNQLARRYTDFTWLVVIMILLSRKLLENITTPKTRKRKTNGKSNKNKSSDKIRDNVTIEDLPNRFFGSLTGGYEAQCWPQNIVPFNFSELTLADLKVN